MGIACSGICVDNPRKATKLSVEPKTWPRFDTRVSRMQLYRDAQLGPEREARGRTGENELFVDSNSERTARQLEPICPSR